MPSSSGIFQSQRITSKLPSAASSRPLRALSVVTTWYPSAPKMRLQDSSTIFSSSITSIFIVLSLLSLILDYPSFI